MDLSKALRLLGVPQNEWISYFNKRGNTHINVTEYLDLYYDIKYPNKTDYSEYNTTGWNPSEYKYSEKKPLKKQIIIQEREIRIGMIYRSQFSNGVTTISIVSPYADKEYTYEIGPNDAEKYNLNLVIYVVSNDNPDKIEKIYNIEDFEITHYKNYNFEKPDGRHIPIEIWDSMKKFKFIIGIDRVSFTKIYQIYIPIKDDKDCITYYESLLAEKDVLDIYIAYKALSLIPELEYYEDNNDIYEDCKQHSLALFNEKVRKIDKYVRAFDFDKVLESFKLRQWGHLQSRPGKDDTFYMGTDRTINCKDKYIENLLKIDDNELSYEKAYKIDDEDYSIYNEEQLNEEKNRALSEYDKTKHLAFLLKIEVDSLVEFVTYKSRLMDRLLIKYNNHFPYSYKNKFMT